jgi:hypothetical protein
MEPDRVLAMPGMRTFSVSANRGNDRVSCNQHGVFIGSVPLLEQVDGYWTARPATELNHELTICYRLPVDIAAKANGLSLIAHALNRGDFAIAAITAVQMQIPDPPSLAKGWENPGEIARRARELARSGLLKFWDPAKHPRAGVPPNPGWFAPTAEESDGAMPVAMRFRPWEKPPILEGDESGGVPRGTLELPFPSGLPRLPWSDETPTDPTTPEGAPKSWTPADPKSKLPFMSESEPQLSPRKEDEPTSGIFRSGDEPPIELQSGYDGPAKSMPLGTDGFDAYTRAHVEGHAAALMRQREISEGTLEINNTDICTNCLRNLPKMLPPGSVLHVILPGGQTIDFQGVTP